jgi:hypothetical protein
VDWTRGLVGLRTVYNISDYGPAFLLSGLVLLGLMYELPVRACTCTTSLSRIMLCRILEFR